MITDSQRLEFMGKLTVDVRRPNGVLLSEWEAEFMASFIRYPQLGFFIRNGQPSLGRRQTVDRMWMRYGPEIGWPHPMDTVHERPRMDEADPAGCEYLVKPDEGGQGGAHQRRCNEPATCQEPGKLRYCAAHAEAVQRDCKRANIEFCLIKFQPQSASRTGNTDTHG